MEPPVQICLITIPLMIMLLGPRATIIAQSCRDTEQDCAGWSARGECASNSAFMTVACPVACGTCSRRSRSLCTDDRPALCPEWRRSGFCTDPLKSPWMRLHCPVSCRVRCTEGVRPAPTAVVTTRRRRVIRRRPGSAEAAPASSIVVPSSRPLPVTNRFGRIPVPSLLLQNYARIQQQRKFQNTPPRRTANIVSAQRGGGGLVGNSSCGGGKGNPHSKKYR